MTDHEEPLERIDPGAFRDLPAGPVPLRWGTEIDGPIIGYVTLSRLDDGTILVSAADRPEDPDDDLVGVGTALQETAARIREDFDRWISPVRWAATYGLDETLEPPREPAVDPELVESVTAQIPTGGYVIPRYFDPVLMLEPGDLIDVRNRGHNFTRYRVLTVDGQTIGVEPLDTPPRCPYGHALNRCCLAVPCTLDTPIEEPPLPR